MQAHIYLASLTGVMTPGRLAIKTVPTKNDVEKRSQAEFLTDYMITLHSDAKKQILDRFEYITKPKNERFLDPSSPEFDRVFYENFDVLTRSCYPYIHIGRESIIQRHYDFLSNVKPHSLTLPNKDHYSTIAEPEYWKDYLNSQIFALLKDRHEIEVGMGIVPIPLPYAVERSNIEANVKKGNVAQALQSFFPMPNPSEIEDSIVNGTYRRRDETSINNKDYKFYFSKFWDEYKSYLSGNVGDMGGVIKKQWNTLYHGSGLLVKTDTFFRNKISGNTLVKPILSEHRCSPENIEITKKQNNEIPGSLAFFNALRMEYSLARLMHYTLTSPKDFQKQILLTNYKRYIERFFIRCAYELLKGKESDKSYLALPVSEKNAAYESAHLYKADIEKLFDEPLRSVIIKMIESPDELDAEMGIKSKQGAAIRRAYKSVKRITKSRLDECAEAQMPAYHFINKSIRQIVPDEDLPLEDKRNWVFGKNTLPSITIVNIGVGPSNAKNITDHLAVLRPSFWIMVGHCGGIRTRQEVGSYVLGSGFVRRDGALRDEVGIGTQIPALPEIRAALNHAIYHSFSQSGVGDNTPESLLADYDFGKDDNVSEADQRELVLRWLHDKHVRTGMIYSTWDRNWETAPTEDVFEDFEQNRIVGVDMESGVIAANGFRHRIHYGAFLCVSDKPLHGVIKMRFFADEFYRSQTNRHLDICLNAVKWLVYDTPTKQSLELSRTLRGPTDPPWR